MAQELASSYAHCEALLRQEDRDHWLATLFAPAAKRPHLHALQVFANEIARVRDRVSQPIAGELRLQWWRDLIEGEARGETEANAVAAALLDTIARYDLSRGTLIDAIEAHRAALYGEAPPSIAALEAFFDRTIGGSIRSQIRVLVGPSAEAGGAVRHAAVALGIAELIRYLPHYVTRRFAVIPDEILARHGLGQGDIDAAVATPAIRSALADLRALARDRLADLRSAKSQIPETAAPALLTVNLVEPLLRASERPGVDPFSTPIEIPQWRRQWVLWRAARRGGIPSGVNGGAITLLLPPADPPARPIRPRRRRRVRHRSCRGWRARS